MQLSKSLRRLLSEPPNKQGAGPIEHIEPIKQDAIVVRLWSNHGQKVPLNLKKVPRKQQKALITNGFQGFDGGDKRDRAAVVCLPERLSGITKKTNLSVGLGGDKRDRTAVVCLPERLSTT